MNEASAEKHSKPSPDVILRRLHEVDEENAQEELEKLNEQILEELQLPENPKIAIDFTIIPYYGEDNPTLVSDSRLPGTKLGIKFAILSVVEEGKTITLKARQVSPFESNISVLKELLDYAQKLLDPSLVLLDRGFYSVDAVEELKSRKLGFIIPAKKTSPVRKACEKFEKGEIPAETDHTVSNSKKEEKVRLLFTERETENGKEIHPFITNLDISPDEASENYGWRWRIETNIRELEKFKPFTTSRSMELRRLYFIVSMTLYNLWILSRDGSERPRAHEFKKWLKRLLKVFRVFGGEKIRPPPVPTLA